MTPMMKQYWHIKSSHRDKILFFRMGDFYEMFDKDAEIAAPILNIVLTCRNKKSQKAVKMCGLPYHSIAGPISKLLQAGLKVAICDQIGSVTLSKAPMERKVTRVLTPGMVYDPESLDSLKAHYLCAFDKQYVSFADISTGEAFFYPLSDTKKQQQIIHLLHPAELVLSSVQKEQSFNRKAECRVPISVHDSVNLQHTTACVKTDTPLSAKRILSYVGLSQGQKVAQLIRPFQKKVLEKTLIFSPQTLEHLEIFKNHKGLAKDTLFFTINRTQTPCGARMLRSRLSQPSTNKAEIEHRWHQVQQWIKHERELKQIRTLLFKVGDIERRLGKISHNQFLAQDLLLLAESLKAGCEVISLYAKTFGKTTEDHTVAYNLAHRIASTIRSDVPIASPLSGGSFIKEGVSVALDDLIQEVHRQHTLLRQLESQEQQETGISSLKIRYNNVFGYYIEVTKVHVKKVPDRYIRKQTLTQAERYTTEKLQVIEGQVLSAGARLKEMEKHILEKLCEDILQHLPDLFYLCQVVCEIDVSTACAWLAIEKSYVKPEFSKDNTLLLVNNRHPVVERKQATPFVPNTIQLNKGECLLLTGPNMAGKSTLMRQVALSVVMAQAGCFVPAQKACLPIFTQLFTRIGAYDSLSLGLSTFMVEMKESAHILQHADEHSLVLLDEIGRGTSTYDGMSLAQAILEHLVTEKKCLTFFATHYRELTVMSNELSAVRNAYLSVKESKGSVDFLYTLTAGVGQGSYGVHVAAKAGVPTAVVKRAEELLAQRETSG